MNPLPFGPKSDEDDLSYEDSKDLARRQDPEVRAELSRREDLRPEILYYLAEDPSPAVRRMVARNANTPKQADRLLVQDADQTIREELAAKVARLTPDLSRSDQKEAQHHVLQTLEVLARDQAARVRQILSEALKDTVDAPNAVIQRLARDLDQIVAAPILEFSPLLTELDLLEIIEEGCVSGKLRAISRRHGLGAQVADAIVATDDPDAITALLENRSTQIREDTLDVLVDMAIGVPAWHEPLVNRPKLTSRAALKLATFIADSLLTKLQSRNDLDKAALKALTQEVHRRLTNPLSEPAEKLEGDAGVSEGQGGAETISDDELAQALSSGDETLVRTGLALRAGMLEAAVERILSSASAKAVTALAWKAGLDMRFAMQLQLRMGGITPRNLLNAKEGAGFPMADEEMVWQLEFFESLTD